MSHKLLLGSLNFMLINVLTRTSTMLKMSYESAIINGYFQVLIQCPYQSMLSSENLLEAAGWLTNESLK